MSSSVSSAGTGRNSSPELEARRQELLRTAQSAGGSQARAVEAGRRRAAALRHQNGTASTTSSTTQTSTAASTSGTSQSTATSQAKASSTTAPKKTGWEVSLDDDSFAALKKATAGQTGSKLDVTA